MRKKGNPYNLTDKQYGFCLEFNIDSNGKQAAIRSGYSKNTAKEQASRLLTNVNVMSCINDLKAKKAKKIELTHEMLTAEWMKIAFSSIAHIHNTWIDKTDFEVLKESNPDILDCIQEIDTKVVKRSIDDEDVVINVEQVKVKLYDKTKALTELGKHISYYSDHNKEKKSDINLNVYSDLTIEELENKLNDIKSKVDK